MVQEDDSILCFYCATAVQNRIPVTGHLFSSTGFNKRQLQSSINMLIWTVDLYAMHHHAVHMAAI